MKDTYFLEITDTFGGEANYSWLRRYLVKAKSERGAVQVLARYYGAGWRFDGMRYNLSGACVCMFVDFINPVDVDDYLARNFNVRKINF